MTRRKPDSLEEERSRTREGAGALFIVATPIGNLEDITLRALRVLKECDLIAAEDTRTALKLLSHFDIHTPVTSYHQHSGGRKTGEILERIAAGENVAMISEAGTPGISDPGHELIRGCIEQGFRVSPVPGACAIVTLLSCCGVNTSAFIFLGFAPRKPGDRCRFFQSLASETRTMVLYESPNRMRETLSAMLEAWGDRKVFLGRELTKLHEEIWRGGLREAVDEFTDRRPRGEFVIAAEGAAPQEQPAADLEQEFHRLLDEGTDERTAISALAKLSGLPRREVYAAVLRWKGKC